MKFIIFFLVLSAFADEPKSAPQQIDPVYLLQMQLLESQATILKLKACSDAKIHHQDCIPNWSNGTVVKAALPAKSEPKVEKK